MKTSSSKQRRLAYSLITAGTLFALVSTNAPARDTDIYFTDPSASGLKPNVLLVIDTSGSMNEYVSDGMSRVDHMKKAMKTIIDDSTNINMGVMRFSRAEGAAVIYPLKDLDATVSDDGHLIAAMQNSADDANESSTGTVTTNATSHTFQSGRSIGIRFRNVYIPHGVHIDSAYVTFIASNSDTGAASMDISADDADNTPEYTTASNNITSRAQTAAVTWSGIADWNSGTRYYTRDISTLVQAVVDRANWQSGNGMAFKFAATTGTRRSYAYDIYNSNGFEGSGPKLVVNYSAGGGTYVTQTNTAVARVNLGTDDAEERVSNGSMTTAQSGSNPIQLTKDGTREQYVGVRFRNIQVPQGATISSAQLEFTVLTQNATAASLTVYGQAADNAATFSGSSGNISSRTKTAASVAWNNLPNPAVGQLLTTPDLTSIVQQIVNRGGWASGNAMAFIIQAQGTSSGPRNVEAYETTPNKAPYLRITYTTTTYQTSGTLTRTGREALKAGIVAMTAGGSTPIVDALYEGALYFRGNAVDYGKVRENASTLTRVLRVSHPESYSGGTLSQPGGCTSSDLEADACKDEQITGSPTYISPVTAGCQSNHIVLLTDGAATANTSSTKVRTMAGASSCSGSGDESCGITLTNYLANNDQFSAFTGTQPIHTHTVGLNISNQFLSDLATNGKGTYQSVNNADELTGAFQEILNQVLSDPTGFVSPSLTVNAFNRLYDQDDVYFSVFSPQLAVYWPGNIKKYRLCDKGESCIFGEVMDFNNHPAIDPNTSKIKATAQSFWSGAPDGPIVDQGGAGAEVPDYTYNTRKVYTYTGAANVAPTVAGVITPVDLTLAAHEVNQTAVGAPTNPALTKAMLGNASMTDLEYYNIIRWMRGQDVQDDNNNSSTTDNRWKFADALHSRPATVTYGGTAANPISKLFVGTNDGGLRMVNTSNDNSTGGQEEWIVYLPEFLPSMKTLMDNNSGEHVVGLDGAPSIWVVDNNSNGIIEPANNDKVYLYMGMRRGGRDIYAFDVTPDSGPVTSAAAVGQIKPKFLWRIKGGVAGDYAGLGQTWSYPKVATVRVKCQSGDATCDDGNSSTPDSKKKTVLIFGGGFDPSQDGVMPPGADAMGNGIYIVDPLNGSLVWRVGGTGSGAALELSAMKYAIASDIGMVDSNGDGAVDRLYVGDTRGQVFRIDLGDQIDPSGGTAAAKNGGSSGYVFADIGCTSGVRSNNCSATAKYERRKFFYAPAIVQSRDSTYSATEDYDLIAIASGDREDPLDKITTDLGVDPVHNRIYALRDYNYQYGAPGTSPAALTETNLYDSTSNALQDPAGSGYMAALADIRSSKGWFVDLRETSNPNWVGEKGLSHPTVFDGVLYVTTYIPPSGGPVAAGTCPPPAEGSARLYGLNYLSGAGIVDLNGSGGIDRYVDIGGGIPSEVVVVSREGGTTAIVGTSGGASVGSSGGGGCTPPFCYPFPDNVSRIPTFWHDN